MSESPQPLSDEPGDDTSDRLYTPEELAAYAAAQAQADPAPRRRPDPLSDPLPSVEQAPPPRTITPLGPRPTAPPPSALPAVRPSPAPSVPVTDPDPEVRRFMTA